MRGELRGRQPAHEITDEHSEREVAMYATDVVWWGYTIVIAAVAAFMVFFALKVRAKGD
jgi:hypothetical protein